MSKSRNPLTSWIAEFIRNQPEASPAQGWKHLTEVAAAHGVLPWIVGFDSDSSLLAYRLDPGVPSRNIGQESFSRSFRRMKRQAGFD